MQTTADRPYSRSSTLLRRHYFVVTSAAMLALTVAGFFDNLVTNVGQPSNHDPKFIVHGLFCAAWMIVLLAQAALVSSGNVRLHRRLGIAAIVIAIGVMLSTLWVFVVVWKGWAAMSPEVKANRLLLPSYALFVTLGLLNRRRPDLHKRYIYAGTLFMLDPVLARAFDPLLVPLMGGFTEPQIEAAFLPSLFGTWLVFYLSLFVYDIAVLRRLHPVSITALGAFIAIWTFAFAS